MMRLNRVPLLVAALFAAMLAACSAPETPPAPIYSSGSSADADNAIEPAYAKQHLGDYAEVELDADLSILDENQRPLLALLVEAADTMNGIFWQQSWGDEAALLARVQDLDTRALVRINYGPWDRLNGDAVFVDGIGARPPGARFYPADMTHAEFEDSPLKDKTSLYTVLRRDAAGALITVPYHEEYRGALEKAAALLRQAAALAPDADFARYLELRAQALLDDNYRPSDLAWMDMKNNLLDLVIGPIETYEDRLFGYKASYEAYVLLKDVVWSRKLERFVQYLPELQRGLPVAQKYKQETPGADADLNVYNALYYAGDANTGAKTIAINLPNDEQVQLQKGTRRLQLENVMRAKFERIMLPIARQLIVDDQQKYLNFDAFFENTMFHEVAHGLGIKNTLDGHGTVRAALRDYASSLEEGKADILGLYMVNALALKGELDESKLMDNYVTFLADTLRSVRFGATDAHAKANMVRFNFFAERGALSRDPDSGRYRVDLDKMRAAVDALAAKILTIQGDGDYAQAKQLTDTLGVVSPELDADLERLNAANIPIDITFRQGLDILGVRAPAPAPAD